MDVFHFWGVWASHKCKALKVWKEKKKQTPRGLGTFYFLIKKCGDSQELLSEANIKY